MAEAKDLFKPYQDQRVAQQQEIQAQGGLQSEDQKVQYNEANQAMYKSILNQMLQGTLQRYAGPYVGGQSPQHLNSMVAQ